MDISHNFKDIANLQRAEEQLFNMLFDPCQLFEEYDRIFWSCDYLLSYGFYIGNILCTSGSFPYKKRFDIIDAIFLQYSFYIDGDNNKCGIFSFAQ